MKMLNKLRFIKIVNPFNSLTGLIGIIFIFAAIFAPNLVSAQPFTCSLENVGAGNPCSGGKTCVFSMSSNSNAHAGDCSAYDWKVCCDNLNNARVTDRSIDPCHSDEVGVISLSDTTNAHIEQYGIGTYSYDVCIEPSPSIGEIICSYESACNPLIETCLASMFQATNSHIAECNSYSTQICCGSPVPSEYDTFGWAWSENIGWISFNCDNPELPSPRCSNSYKVTIDADTGEFSGYAYSENIDWISFNKSDLTGCPSGTCEAKLEADNTVTGWARALAYDGGWDGWIKLRGTAADASPYGVSLNPSTKEFEGYAWGSDVVGWLSFNCENREEATGKTCLDATDPSFNPAVNLVDYQVRTAANIPPYVENLGLNENYCTDEKEKGHIELNWTYRDSDGNSQYKYNLQVDDESSFSAPRIVDLVDIVQIIEPDTTGTSSVFVKPVIIGDNDILYSDQYYWRVQVQDTGESWSEWVEGVSFTTPSHAYPYPDFTWSPESPAVDEEVQFCSVYEEGVCPEDLSESFGGTTISSWLWDFGDGDSDNVQNPVHTYLIPGPYSASLEITDSDGFSCERLLDIEAKLPLPWWKEILPRW